MRISITEQRDQWMWGGEEWMLMHHNLEQVGMFYLYPLLWMDEDTRGKLAEISRPGISVPPSTGQLMPNTGMRSFADDNNRWSWALYDNEWRITTGIYESQEGPKLPYLYPIIFWGAARTAMVHSVS